MSKAALDNLLQDLHRIAGVDALRDHTDADLLACFATHRDEAAFATLVWRHGGLVFGVCKRMLSNEQDAEDAFQAAFLTLAHKANSISNRESLPAWLYRVAYRIALRARKKTPMQRMDAETLNGLAARDAGHDLEKREVLQSLDEEIAKLPTSSARAIVLCYFEGKTHEEAAVLLGCPKGTLASWIARARQQLHDRLTQRGCTLTAAALATLLADQASATPVEWISPTAKAAIAFVSGTAAASGILSANAVVLSEGMLRMMWFNKVKMFAAVALIVLTLGMSAGVLANAVWGSGRETPVVKNDADADQGGAQAELAKLRDEIAKLRAELKDAINEIKSLKQSLPEKPAEALYKGKPTSFWLEQLNDGAASFRVEATVAIGSLAKKNKKLIPTLLQRIHDESDHEAASALLTALGEVGPEVLPALIDLAKDKSLDFPKYQRRRAIEAIGYMRADAKPAVPVLANMLKERPPIGTCRITLYALELIGPDAKEAIPALVETMEYCLRDIGKTGDDSFFGSHESAINFKVRATLFSIEPSLRAQTPGVSQLVLTSPGVAGIDKKQVEVAWRTMIDSLKQKYPAPK